MSLFKYLFGSRKSNNYPKTQQATSPIALKGPELNFDELKSLLPEGFQKFISQNEGKEIILELPDEKYRILHSLTTDSNKKDPYENIALRYDDWNYHDVLKSTNIRIPFARNLTGDQFKYLFFEGEDRDSDFNHIYFTDSDSHIGQLEITSGIEFQFDKIHTLDANRSQINLIPQSLNSLAQKIDLPASIKYKEDSFSCNTRDLDSGTAADGISIEQYCMNYNFLNKEDNFVNIETHTSLVINNKRISGYSEYEIDNSNLPKYISFHSDSYRTFYFKYFCIIHAWKLIKDFIAKESICETNQFEDLVTVEKLIEFSHQQFKGIETRNP